MSEIEKLSDFLRSYPAPATGEQIHWGLHLSPARINELVATLHRQGRVKVVYDHLKDTSYDFSEVSWQQ